MMEFDLHKSHTIFYHKNISKFLFLILSKLRQSDESITNKIKSKSAAQIVLQEILPSR